MLRTFATAPFAVLLSLVLLFSQQAGVRHGLSHLPGHAVAAVAAAVPHDDPGGSDPDGHAPGEVCRDCLAFAQIDGAMHADVAPPALLCGMRFPVVVAQQHAVQHTACPAQRSRGPPSLV